MSEIKGEQGETVEPDNAGGTGAVADPSVSANSGAQTSASSSAATGAPRSYRAIFFDLDGTLLPMELEEFLGSYYASLGAFFAKRGADPQTFGEALKAGIHAMARHSGDVTNEQAFFGAFFASIDEGERDWMTLFAEYYENEFPKIGEGVEPDPAAARAVKALADKGYTLVLTTMPMFPRTAVLARLKWAGVDPSYFARITSFENSASIKPHLTYYAENLAATNLAGGDVLMVGNNTVEDLAALDLGTDAFLVTDHLLDSVGYDLSTVKHGSLEEFAQWAEKLPACASPADRVETTAVSWPRTEKAYNANALTKRSSGVSLSGAGSRRAGADVAFGGAAGQGAASAPDNGRPSCPPIEKPACPSIEKPSFPPIARPSAPADPKEE